MLKRFIVPRNVARGWAISGMKRGTADGQSTILGVGP